MLAGIHPTIAAALRPHLRSADITKRAHYVAALRAHDWAYQWADDGNVYRRGSAERQALRATAAEIDPDREIWNMHCPAAHRVLPWSS